MKIYFFFRLKASAVSRRKKKKLVKQQQREQLKQQPNKESDTNNSNDNSILEQFFNYVAELKDKFLHSELNKQVKLHPGFINKLSTTKRLLPQYESAIESQLYDAALGLSNDKPIKYHDHNLTGELSGLREFHLLNRTSDILVVYKKGFITIETGDRMPAIIFISILDHRALADRKIALRLKSISKMYASLEEVSDYDF